MLDEVKHLAKNALFEPLLGLRFAQILCFTQDDISVIVGSTLHDYASGLCPVQAGL